MYKIRKQVVEVLNLKAGTLDYGFRVLQNPKEHQSHRYFIDDAEVTEDEFKEYSSQMALVTI